MIEFAEDLLDEIYDLEYEYDLPGDCSNSNAEDFEDNLHVLTSNKLQF